MAEKSLANLEEDKSHLETKLGDKIEDENKVKKELQENQVHSRIL